MRPERVVFPLITLSTVLGIASLVVFGALARDPGVLRGDVLAAQQNRCHAAIFSLLVALLIFSYLRTVLTHPGHAKDWVHARPDLIFPAFATSFSEGDDVEAAAGPGTTPSTWHFCSICDADKPPRVAHSRAGGTCILRYDHFVSYFIPCLSRTVLKVCCTIGVLTVRVAFKKNRSWKCIWTSSAIGKYLRGLRATTGGLIWGGTACCVHLLTMKAAFYLSLLRSL